MEKITEKETKEFTNERINILIDSYSVDTSSNKIIKLTENQIQKYSDLIIQIVKIPRGKEGMGDIEEQDIRMEILREMRTLPEKQVISFNRHQRECIEKILPFWKVAVLDESLIEFQKKLKIELDR